MGRAGWRAGQGGGQGAPAAAPPRRGRGSRCRAARAASGCRSWSSPSWRGPGRSDGSGLGDFGQAPELRAPPQPRSEGLSSRVQRVALERACSGAVGGRTSYGEPGHFACPCWRTHLTGIGLASQKRSRCSAARRASVAAAAIASPLEAAAMTLATTAGATWVLERSRIGDFGRVSCPRRGLPLDPKRLGGSFCVLSAQPNAWNVSPWRPR